MLKLKQWALSKAGAWDIAILGFLLILISWHPFYLYGQVNLFEMGLYLPGIDAIFHGQVPYRDFVHLRGPLELYLPAWWMALTGRHFAVMPTYFYLGTIATLIACLMVAKEIFRSRIFIYVMVFAFLARTFPRVTFTIGGGFRFAWGVAAIFCAIKYFENKNKGWLWGAGIFSAIALLTSIEIGVYAIAAIFLSLCVGAWLGRPSSKPLLAVGIYSLATFIAILPMGVFLYGQQALGPMIETYDQVVFNMVKTFPQLDPVPHTFLQIVMAMFNPKDVNFQHMTPLFCYLAAFVYVFFVKEEKRQEILCLALYAFLLYVGSMRSLWGPAFESALQPEKILLFILLERVWFAFKDAGAAPWRKITAGALLAAIILSTVVYVLPRFQKRFYFVKVISSLVGGGKHHKTALYPYGQPGLVSVNLPVMKGMMVPVKQQQDMEQLYSFIHQHTAPTQAVLFFPDLGAYHFIVDRPFMGRFPMVILSWIGPHWHEEFMQALENQAPAYVVTYKRLPAYIPETQLIIPENNLKYQAVLAFIEGHYQIVSSTPSLNIWQRAS